MDPKPEPDFDCVRIVLLETFRSFLKDAPLGRCEEVRYAGVKQVIRVSSKQKKKLDFAEQDREMTGDEPNDYPPRIIGPHEMIPVKI